MHMGGCTNDLSPNFIIWHQKNHGYSMHNLGEWSPWSLASVVVAAAAAEAAVPAAAVVAVAVVPAATVAAAVGRTKDFSGEAKC